MKKKTVDNDFFSIFKIKGALVHTFNPATQEAEVSRSLNLRPPQIPGQTG